MENEFHILQQSKYPFTADSFRWGGLKHISANVKINGGRYLYFAGDEVYGNLDNVQIQVDN